MAEEGNNSTAPVNIKKLAKESLQKCYGPEGIYAGKHQFKDYWARDSAWAGLGALELGDTSIVKKNLTTFFKHEEHGILPIRVGNKFFIQTYFMWPHFKLYPKFPKHKAFDSGSLQMMLLYQYYLKTKDKKFVESKMPMCDRIVHEYLRESGKDWLIDEGIYGGWMDGLKKYGKVFYTNLLMYVGLESYYKLCNKINYKPLIKQDALQKLKQILNSTFWVGDHYLDYVDGPEGKYFDTFANLIAIYFDFCTRAQSANILDYIQKKNLIKPDGSIEKSYPRYPRWMTNPNLRLVGLAGYAEGITYPWMSFFYYACVKKLDRTPDQGFENLKLRILKSNTIHECYTFKGRPYRSLLYTSEHPFAWAASFALLSES